MTSPIGDLLIDVSSLKPEVVKLRCGNGVGGIKKP